MSDRERLRLVDPETQEISDEAPSYRDALQLLSDLQLTIGKLDDRHKADLLRIAELESDAEERELASPYRPRVEALHKLHAAATKANKKTPSRRKRLDVTERRNAAACVRILGFRKCVEAVVGLTWDPGWSDPRRNGTRECFNSFELCFRNSHKASSFAERTPQGYEPEPWRIAEFVDVDVERIGEWLKEGPVKLTSREAASPDSDTLGTESAASRGAGEAA